METSQKEEWYFPDAFTYSKEYKEFSRSVKCETNNMQKNFTVCRVFGNTQPECDQRTKLIAAAPDLFRLLNELYNMVYGHLMDGEAASNGRRIAKEIEEAIKKATT